MDKQTVLICDPDTAVCRSLEVVLTAGNYNVLTAADGAAAREILGRTRVDIMILEARLPDGDGFELCRSLHAKSEMPMIFLSSLAEEFDRVLGLKIGADDYISKPFSPREVAARVEAVLRRARPLPAGKNLSVAELSLYPESFTAFVGGDKLELIPSDFKLLSYMVENLGKVLTREKILDAVWGFEYYGNHRSVDTQIKRIRAALRDKDVHFAIYSIYGVGYKLDVVNKTC